MTVISPEDKRQILEEVWKPYKAKWKKLYDYVAMPDDVLQAICKAIDLTEEIVQERSRK